MNNLDLIRQYVNTGQPIGDYQVSKLPGNILKSYLRKRLQSSEQNEEYKLTKLESLYAFLTPEELKPAIHIIEKDEDFFTELDLNKLTPEERKVAIVLSSYYMLCLPNGYRCDYDFSKGNYTKEEIKLYVDSYVKFNPKNIYSLLKNYDLKIVLPIIGQENLKKISNEDLRDFLNYRIEDFSTETYKLIELYLGKDRIDSIRKKWHF